VKHAVDAGHGRLERFAIGDVAGVHLHTERLQHAGPLGRAHERDHFVAPPDELLDDLPADETSGAGDEILRHYPATD
jgi:hypothetical protein